MEHFDVAIQGGSLAGSAAGITLARQGKKVLILEKDFFPRNKVCGEFLSPGIWPLLSELGVSQKILASGNAINSAIIHFPSQRALSLPFPDASNQGLSDSDLAERKSHGWGISRAKLDLLLLEEAGRAGCRVEYGSKVERVQNKGSHFEIEIGDRTQASSLKVASTHFLEASGFRKKVEVGDSDKKSGLFGFKAHFRGVPASRDVELFYFSGGYVGLSGIENGITNLCGMCGRDLLQKSRGSGEAILESAIREIPLLEERLRDAHRIGDWLFCGPLNHGKSSLDSVTGLAVGDAAFFLEPFMGQGMTMALAGGIMTAKLLSKHGNRGRDFLRARHRRAMKNLYRQRLNVGNFPVRLMPQTAVSKTVNRLSSHLPWLWELAVKTVCRTPAMPPFNL